MPKSFDRHTLAGDTIGKNNADAGTQANPQGRSRLGRARQSAARSVSLPLRIRWPNIRQWLDRALYAESDPIPVTAKDLGELASSKPQGQVATELNWKALSPDGFERLVFNLIDQTKGYENPQWLTHTSAADRGRDLSVERILQDPTAGSRKQRVILACKHTDKENVKVVSELQAQMRLWDPPRVDELIIVTTGRFTTDAIDWIEKHNQSSDVMRIEMWANSHLERLLARRPELIAEFKLRS